MARNFSDRLGTMPITKLIFKMSGPAIFSMLIQALYNIVDSIFIGAYDATNGVIALSYAMPMQLLVLAFALGFGVGTASVISRKLGEGNKVDASLAAQTGTLIALFMGLVFLVVGYFVSHAFIDMYTSSAAASVHDETNWDLVAQYGGDYLTICTCCSMGFFVEIMLNRIIQATGNMTFPMISQLVGALTNIILDPIMILPFGANLGAKGAAIATVVGQWCAMLVPVLAISIKKWEIPIFVNKNFRLKWRILKQIFVVGLPSIVLNAIGSVMYMTANFIMNSFANAVWSFGIYFKLQSFVFMPVFGMNQGVMPILGYNYGANKRRRFDETFLKAILLSMGYMTFGLIIFHTMPEYLVQLFSPDTPEKAAAGVEALRLCSIPFISAAISVILIAMFNAVGQGTKAMMISLMRQLFLLLPLGYILSKFTNLGVTGFWLAFIIAEIATMLTFTPIAFVTIDKLFMKRQIAYETATIFSDAEWLDNYYDTQKLISKEKKPEINWDEFV